MFEPQPVNVLVRALHSFGIVLATSAALLAVSGCGNTGPTGDSKVEADPADAYRPQPLIAANPADSQRTAQAPITAPATPVSEVVPPRFPDWRKMPVALYPSRTEKQLAVSMQKSAVTIDLYEKEYAKTNSHTAIFARMDKAREQVEAAIEEQRELSCDLLDHNKKYRNDRSYLKYRAAIQRLGSRPAKSMLPYDRGIAAVLAKTGPSEDTREIHDLSPHYNLVQDWAIKRGDLAGLPYQDFQDCTMDHSAAKTLATHSANFRLLQGGRIRRDSPNVLRYLNSSKKWQAEDIPALVQIIQVEPEQTRLDLVAILSRLRRNEATEAIARRAIFDPSPIVREEAIAVLSTRPANIARPVLLLGLQYPWGPAATHAARALVGISDIEAVPQLERLYNQPDPQAPFRTSDGKWAVRELTRLNHMRNCFVCHAPSLSEYDTCRGFVPSPGERLPRLYYQQRSQSGYFVRADVTYLRQDFSMMHNVENHGKWPQSQRFDYLVRTRAITDREAARIRKKLPKVSEQRNAILYALHQLSANLPGRK